MTNFFSGKKKLFALLFLAAIALAIPLTVIISQQQQTIKQRAAPLESLSFTKSGETASLALSTENNGLTGFDITFSSDNPISPQSISLPSHIQNNFGQELINQQVSCDNGKFCYRIARIIRLGEAPVPTDNGRLDIADFTNVKDQGDIKVVSAAVTSISGKVPLSSSNPSLSYFTNLTTSLPADNASPPPPTPTNTQTSVLTCIANYPCSNKQLAKCFSAVTIIKEKTYETYQVQFNESTSRTGNAQATVTTPQDITVEYKSNWSRSSPEAILSRAISEGDKVAMAVALAAGANVLICANPLAPIPATITQWYLSAWDINLDGSWKNNLNPLLIVDKSVKNINDLDGLLSELKKLREAGAPNQEQISKYIINVNSAITAVANYKNTVNGAESQLRTLPLENLQPVKKTIDLWLAAKEITQTDYDRLLQIYNQRLAGMPASLPTNPTGKDKFVYLFNNKIAPLFPISAGNSIKLYLPDNKSVDVNKWYLWSSVMPKLAALQKKVNDGYIPTDKELNDLEAEAKSEVVLPNMTLIQNTKTFTLGMIIRWVDKTSSLYKQAVQLGWVEIDLPSADIVPGTLKSIKNLAASDLISAVTTLTPASVFPTSAVAVVPVKTVTIQGHYVDQNGKPTGSNGRTITISGGTISSPVTAANDLNPKYLWKKDSLPPSDNSYTVTASSLTAGYTISYVACTNTNCDKESARDYIAGNSVSVNLSTAEDYADIYFKYTPIAPTLSPTPTSSPILTPTFTPTATKTPTPTISKCALSDVNILINKRKGGDASVSLSEINAAINAYKGGKPCPEKGK